MAGCFDDLLAVEGASANGDAREVEPDGCCPSKAAARTDAEHGSTSLEPGATEPLGLRMSVSRQVPLWLPGGLWVRRGRALSFVRARASQADS